MLGVVDYEAGNGQSVVNALRWLGLEARACPEPGDLDGCAGILLPGVGSAGATMDSLRSRGHVTALNELVVERGVPFLGICVGLQILFDRSDESDATCLGWLPGHVRRLDDTEVRVPQIGWNQVYARREHPVLATVPDGSHFYFVNSYRAVPDDPDHVVAVTNYPDPFPSIVSSGNITGVQFHAEKSSTFGLQLLREFAAMSGVAPC